MNQAIFVNSIRYNTNPSKLVELASWIHYIVLRIYVNKVKSFVYLDDLSISIVIVEHADEALIPDYFNKYCKQSQTFDIDIVKSFMNRSDKLDFNMAILRSISENNLEAFKLLYKHSTNLANCLDLACQCGRHDILELLIARIPRYCIFNTRFIKYAVDSGNYGIVKLLLDNGFVFGFSSFESCVCSNRLDLVELLLSTDPDRINSASNSFSNVFKCVIDNRLYTMMELFLKYIKKHIYIYTVLEYVFQVNDIHFVKMLLTSKEHIFDNMWIYATRNKNTELLELLSQFD